MSTRKTKGVYSPSTGQKPFTVPAGYVEDEISDADMGLDFSKLDLEKFLSQMRAEDYKSKFEQEFLNNKKKGDAE